jgi:hypothetical protein
MKTKVKSDAAASAWDLGQPEDPYLSKSDIVMMRYGAFEGRALNARQGAV